MKFLNIFLLILPIIFRFKNINGNCLPDKERVKWIREFNFRNQQSTLKIETSPRPSHKIVSYIAKILIQERLGYRSVAFNEVKWDSIDDVIRRLNSSLKSENGDPVSHINMEVWMSPGYNFNNQSINMVDCGPLGPNARKGIFIKSNENIDPPLWFWSTFTNKENNLNTSIVTYKEIGFNIDFKLLNSKLFPNNKIVFMDINQTFKQSPKVILSWYPNLNTVYYNYTRVLYPDCWDSKYQIYCEFEVHQLSKVVWSYIKTHVSRVYELINKFHLSQSQYIDLLKSVNVLNPDQESQYYNVACNWILNNFDTWKQWTNQWNVKDQVYLPIFITDYGPWRAAETFNDSLSGVVKLNEQYLNNTHIQVKPIIKILRCNNDDIINAYLSVSETYNKKIIGCILCLCPEKYDTVIKIADIENRIIISSSMELSNNHLSFSEHFFSTFPNMRLYNLILIKLFLTLNWRRVVIIKREDFILDLQEFRRHNIEVLDILENSEEEITYNASFNFLKKAKEEHKASIYVVDYLGEVAAGIVMCAAGNLKMTLENGFVFILNPFLSPKWHENIVVESCRKNKNLASKEYFIIKHDFVSEHRKLYRRDNKYKNILSLLTNDAIINLGKSFGNLLKQIPSAYLSINDPSISRKYINLLVNESQVILGEDSQFQRRIFDDHHKRTGIWQMSQISYFGGNMYITMPIYKWDSIDPKLDPSTKLPILKSLRHTNIYWGKSKIPLPDTIITSDCVVELLRAKMDISCTAAIIVIHFMALLIFTTLFILMFFLLYRRNKQSTPEDPNKKLFEDLCNELIDIDIKSSDVVIEIKVGKGAYGEVFGGEAKRNNRWEPVAIKIIQKEVDYQGKIDFLMEAKLMRDLDHKNIVKLIGICLNSPKPLIYLVMELVVNGDLEDYLLSNRITARNNPENKSFCPAKLSGFVKDIASGAEYLHQHNLLHRDLACRNCLLSEEDVVKIGDFGLTRLIDASKDKNYYKVSRHFELPARWIPPEAVQIGFFSVKSDIWSLGVVIFEISTFCSRPYYDISDDAVTYIVKNNIHSLVSYLPAHAKGSDVYNLIDKCCRPRMEDRFDSMGEIVKIIENNPECIKAYLTDDPPYATSLNILNKIQSHVDNNNQMVAPINPSHSLTGNSNNTSGMISKIKSSSKVKINSSVSCGPSVNYLDNMFHMHNHIMDDDTRREFDYALEGVSSTRHSSNFLQENFLPLRFTNDTHIINTSCRNNNRHKKNKQNRSSSKKNRSNLNNAKSRSSDLTTIRLDDDQEHSYVSCPDNQPHPLSSLDIDPHDFKDVSFNRYKSTSKGGMTRTNIYPTQISTKKKHTSYYNGLRHQTRHVKKNLKSTTPSYQNSQYSQISGREVFEPLLFSGK